MKRSIMVFILTAAAGCATTDSTKDITFSGEGAEVSGTWTKIEKSDLEGATPVAVLSKSEVVEYFADQAGLPKFGEEYECDKAIDELRNLGFETLLVTKTQVKVNLPDQGMVYQYKFSGEPCSQAYLTQ